MHTIRFTGFPTYLATRKPALWQICSNNTSQIFWAEKKSNWGQEKNKARFFFWKMCDEMPLYWEKACKEMFTWKFIISIVFNLVPGSWSRGVLQGCQIFRARRRCSVRSSSPERVAGGQGPDSAQLWELSQSRAEHRAPNPIQYQCSKY